MRIKLQSKFLYSIKNKDDNIEEHFRERYLYIGYKNQFCFLSIIEEDFCKIFIYADMLWRSKF